MASKKKSKSVKQTNSIVTPKVSGKKIDDCKNAVPALEVQSSDSEKETVSSVKSESESSIEGNTVPIGGHLSEESEEQNNEEVAISIEGVSEEKELSIIESTEGPEPNNNTEKLLVADTAPKTRKKKISKAETVKLVGTSYHYFRGWLKNHLSESGLKGFRFIKDDVGWKGYILIPAENFDAAMKALQEFKNSQPEGTKDLFW